MDKFKVYKKIYSGKLSIQRFTFIAIFLVGLKKNIEI